MSWSSSKASIQGEVNSIRNELLDIITQLQQSCIGIGEVQLSQGLNSLRDELKKARDAIDSMR